ncbi:MAG TPA: glycosyltransferase family 4 protein [Baekduia sp.]|uniref:glycosyltransferase family 4 protein n=1 Tax=Baekduia sp. TaxID=2600305 RepID=UPI002BCA0AF2|nr:glycosyltransferase family 4 protein [Baekduia sp.]HMJ36469.1 glycosyltransferase family 4 protein [Baekduia sp.]
MSADTRPVVVVTNHVPPDRAGAFRALHEREGIELALFGGRSHHATGAVDDPGVPHRAITQREAYGLAASGAYRAVIAGTAGRTALPAAWRGARRAGVPFVLWSALWSHPRTPAHVLAGVPLLRAIYRGADAVVTYGPHVSAFVAARGAHNVHVAPQAVDVDFWSAPAGAPHRPAGAEFVALNVGRPARYKGLTELLAAWKMSGFGPPKEALELAGEAEPDRDPVPGVHAAGRLDAPALRNFYAGADVLVMSAIATREFREPWGLVANEAMHQRLPVIATTAVGAAAGGLVRHERNGLVVPAGDTAALARALRTLRDDPTLRERLGAAAAQDAAAHTFAAWAAGFSEALVSVGAGHEGDR